MQRNPGLAQQSKKTLYKRRQIRYNAAWLKVRYISCPMYAYARISWEGQTGLWTPEPKHPWRVHSLGCQNSTDGTFKCVYLTDLLHT
jgi:hypothetical protein